MFDIFQKREVFLITFLYIPLKLFTVFFLVVIFSSFFERDYFYYSDFSDYTNCNLFSGNPFFSALLCSLGITSSQSPVAIVLALLLTLTKDAIFIFIAAKILNNNVLLLYIALLGLHPYLGIYSGILTTDLFSCLAVALLYHRIAYRSMSILHDLVAIVLTGFRNGLAFLYFIYYSVTLWQQLGEHKSLLCKRSTFLILKFTAIIVSLAFLCALSPAYLKDYVNDSTSWPLSYSFFQNIYLSYFDISNNFNLVLSHLFALSVTPIVHIFFLLGAREGAYTLFYEFLTFENKRGIITIGSFVIFFVIHFVGLATFIRKYFKDNVYYLLPLGLLLPYLYLVAHMRYFLPFIPVALLGLCLLLQNKK